MTGMKWCTGFVTWKTIQLNIDLRTGLLVAGVCSNTKFKQGRGTLMGRISSINFVLQCVFGMYTLVIARSKFVFLISNCPGDFVFHRSVEYA